MKPRTPSFLPFFNTKTCLLPHSTLSNMNQNSYQKARTHTYMPSTTVPPRFRNMSKNASNVRIYESETFYNGSPHSLTSSYCVAADAAKPSPPTSRSETINSRSSSNSSPTSTTSSLPSSTTSLSTVDTLLINLEGPVSSLFYDVPRIPLPVDYIVASMTLPASHPRMGDSYGSLPAVDRAYHNSALGTAQYPTQGSSVDGRSASSSRRQELEDLRHRLVREHLTNGRGGHPSLSTTIKTLEEATVGRHTDAHAFIDILGKFLIELIRDFSPRYTPAEILPYITYWVELKQTVGEIDKKIKEEERKALGIPKPRPVAEVKVKENKKLEKAHIFAPLRQVLTQTIMDIWQPAVRNQLLSLTDHCLTSPL